MASPIRLGKKPTTPLRRDEKREREREGGKEPTAPEQLLFCYSAILPFLLLLLSSSPRPAGPSLIRRRRRRVPGVRPIRRRPRLTRSTIQLRAHIESSTVSRCLPPTADAVKVFVELRRRLERPTTRVGASFSARAMRFSELPAKYVSAAPRTAWRLPAAVGEGRRPVAAQRCSSSVTNSDFLLGIVNWRRF